MFEWDDAKRLAALEKHGIDFVDAIEVFAETHIVLRGKSETEDRKIAIGDVNRITIAVVFTMRGDTIRIITARRARKDEREHYQAHVAGRHS